MKRSLHLFLCLLFLAPAAHAMSVIRDAEMEHILYSWGRPVFQAAGLDPTSVEIVVVNDPVLNAYVKGGQRLYLNTGLLLAASNAEQIIGVIAHEVGHIAGGHISRLVGQAEDAGTALAVSYLLGAVTAVATGNAQAGMAVASAGSHLTTQGFLSFTRGQERAADRAAVDYLAALDMSPQGLQQFLKILDGQYSWRGADETPYLRTHPGLQERMAFIAGLLEAKPAPLSNPRREEECARLQGKLTGFLEAPQRVLAKVLRQEQQGALDLRWRYAKAIALYRLPDMAAAEAQIAPLLDASPNDPYYRELQAQMWLENGDAARGEALYRQALAVAPEEDLIRFGLARAQVERIDEGRENAVAAARNLHRALNKDPHNIQGWQLLARAEAAQGNYFAAELALAERAWIRQDADGLAHHLARAETLNKNASTDVRLGDLQNALVRLKKQQQEE